MNDDTIRPEDLEPTQAFQSGGETPSPHPDRIGAIYESGRTEDGQHFFAVELVRGETLDASSARSKSASRRSRGLPAGNRL